MKREILESRFTENLMLQKNFKINIWQDSLVYNLNLTPFNLKNIINNSKTLTKKHSSTIFFYKCFDCKTIEFHAKQFVLYFVLFNLRQDKRELKWRSTRYKVWCRKYEYVSKVQYICLSCEICGLRQLNIFLISNGIYSTL